MKPNRATSWSKGIKERLVYGLGVVVMDTLRFVTILVAPALARVLLSSITIVNESLLTML